MSVTVTAPKTRVVSRGSCVFSWTPQYPQSRYEIQYRLKGVDTWSTLGVVTSSDSSVELDLSVFEDFREYHYRIICYSDDAQSGDSVYSGSDISPAYSIVVCPAAVVGALRVKYGEGMLEVPLYASVDHGPRFRRKTSGGIGETALVSPEDAIAAPIRVRVNGDTKALPKGTAVLPDPGIPGSESLSVDKCYSDTYQYKNANYYRYYYLSKDNFYYYKTDFKYNLYATYSYKYKMYTPYAGTYYLFGYGRYTQKYYYRTLFSYSYNYYTSGYSQYYTYQTGYYSAYYRYYIGT